MQKGHGARGATAWNEMLLRSRRQAEKYARSLAAPETRPPFLVVVDVGHSIELYSEFTQTGGTYIPFPDASSHRIRLAQLADPARRSAKVTREIADKLAQLAKSFGAAEMYLWRAPS